MNQNSICKNHDFKNNVLKNRRQRQHAQRGVALLEVLIAFFVLAIGLMGLAGLQLKSVQFNQASYQRSQATIAAYDMTDRMRMNHTAATGNLYNTGGFVSTHSAGSLADNDLNEWLTSISGNLPDGEGLVNCDANDVCVVSIQWANRFESPSDPDDDFEVVSLATQM